MVTTPPVIFDFPQFTALFPEFSGLGPALCSAYFMRATGNIISNSTTNPMYGDGNLPFLIYLATAHVAYLNCPKDQAGNPSAGGTPASQAAGRVSSASQGSVSVQTEWPANDPSGQEKYLMQTKYGQEYIAAMGPYKTGRYAARPTIIGRWR